MPSGMLASKSIFDRQPRVIYRNALFFPRGRIRPCAWMLRANGILTPACPSLYLPRLAPLKPAQPPSGAYQNRRLMKPADYYSLSLPSIYTRARGKPPSRFPTPRKTRPSGICRPPSHTTQTPAPCRLPPQSTIHSPLHVSPPLQTSEIGKKALKTRPPLHVPPIGGRGWRKGM